MSEPHQRLRWAREKAGYRTATDAAKALGFKGTQVSTYLGHENGSRPFTANAVRYASKFRVSVDWLLTNRGSPKGGSPVLDMLNELPPEAQRQVIDYVQFLKQRQKGGNKGRGPK